MEITQSIIKPITEISYLSVENTKRYRPIMRFFFDENEQMNYFLYKEDIYKEFVGKEGFEDYTLEKAESDLTALTTWKNLIPIQDTSNVTTIEEFKSKKYRYQLSEYSIEIERLVYKLENMHIEGTSLEPSLIERIKEQILKIDEIKDKDFLEVHSWWQLLNEDFKRLNEKYKDYIRSFYNIKLEEIAKSHEFILRKNDLVKYLRMFIKVLQENSQSIQGKLESIEEETENIILDKILIAQKQFIKIDKLDEKFDEELVYEKNLKSLKNLKAWFIGTKDRTSYVIDIDNKTTEIIRKITRVADQIAESKGNANNRKEEYGAICKMFCKTKDIEEAHILAATVFGISSTRHIKGDFSKYLDDTNTSILDLETFAIEIKPRISGYRIKEAKVAIENKKEMKEQVKKEYLIRKEKEQAEFEKIIKDGKIVIAELKEIEPFIRKKILSLITKANQTEIKQTKLEDGRNIKLIYPQNNQRCILKSLDGKLEMPAFELHII